MSAVESVDPVVKGNGGTPLLEARNLSKYFGNVIALKDVSVRVDKNEVTCVLGDNGAGKSTFIKILSGVHHHDEGEYLIEGEETRFNLPRHPVRPAVRVQDINAAAVPAVDPI